MKALFLEDDKSFKFENVISLEIKGLKEDPNKGLKVKIRYKDSHGEVHEEIGRLPEDIYVFRDKGE